MWKKCEDSSYRAQSALTLAGNDPKRAEIHVICKETNIALARSRAALSRFQSRTTALQKIIQRMEASFAQSEVLDFIHCGRYEPTPLHFANALAGLPHIRWRQSTARCVRMEGRGYHRLTYIQFLIVTETLKHCSTSSDEAIEQMRTRLLKANGQDVGSLIDLAENWYFFRCAVEAAFQGNSSLGDSLPFTIFADYQRRVGSKGPLDSLLAEGEIITTPAFEKWRSR